MMIDVIGVRPLGDYKLEIEFSDGTIGVRDFASIVNKTGAMAEPLKDPVYFARVFIEDGALTWPNGYDWDPIRAARRDEGSGIAPPHTGSGVEGGPPLRVQRGASSTINWCAPAVIPSNIGKFSRLTATNTPTPRVGASTT